MGFVTNDHQAMSASAKPIVMAKRHELLLPDEKKKLEEYQKRQIQLKKQEQEDLINRMNAMQLGQQRLMQEAEKSRLAQFGAQIVRDLPT